MQIVLDTRGLQLSVKNACFLIGNDSETHIIHPQRINSILVTAQCRISSPALLLAAEYQIPLTICNACGLPAVRMWSPRFVNTSLLRRKQYRFCESIASYTWAREIIGLKIDAQIHNLQYISNRKASLAPRIREAGKLIEHNMDRLNKLTNDLTYNKKQLLYCEAYAAAHYWQLLGLQLAEPFRFTGRIKKRPPDGFNASINYLYAMLRNQVETAALSIGLDPALGIMHRDGYNMPSLVFDLMEPFRPVIDRVLLKYILSGSFQEDMYSLGENTFQLTKQGRRKLISLFIEKLNTRIIYRGGNTFLKNHILTETKWLSEKIRES